MGLPKIWIKRVQEGYGAEVYARWIIEGKILHIYARLHNVNHYWFSEGDIIDEEERRHTKISFFDEDSGDEFMFDLCIEGNWYVYYLYEKGIFDALLVNVEYHSSMCDKTLNAQMEAK